MKSKEELREQARKTDQAIEQWRIEYEGTQKEKEANVKRQTRKDRKREKKRPPADSD